MATYLRLLGVCLLAAGLAGSVICWRGVRGDDAYYQAAKALEKYPGNILYTNELRMAEPKHLLLVTGTYAGATLGIVLGSICMGLASVLARQRRLSAPS